MTLEEHKILRQQMIDHLEERDDLYTWGNLKNHTAFFKSWNRNQEKFQITSKKPHSNKDNISVEIEIYSLQYEENAEHGVEFKIEMYMWGYQTQEHVFQGWAESMNEFEIILKAVGL